jgi:crotonobetainyl-CoA:carnitine CoA-transferase CaiB-like acyl-CoA transferase
MVAEEARTRTTAEWLGLLQELDIPCARANDLNEVLADPHLEAVGLLEDINDPCLGALRQLRSPFLVDGERFDQPSGNRVAPRLGQHTREVLERLGYDSDRIDQLVAEGVVVLGPRPDLEAPSQPLDRSQKGEKSHEEGLH